MIGRGSLYSFIHFGRLADKHCAPKNGARGQLSRRSINAVEIVQELVGPAQGFLGFPDRIVRVPDGFPCEAYGFPDFGGILTSGGGSLPGRTQQRQQSRVIKFHSWITATGPCDVEPLDNTEAKCSEAAI